MSVALIAAQVFILIATLAIAYGLGASLWFPARSAVWQFALGLLILPVAWFCISMIGSGVIVIFDIPEHIVENDVSIGLMLAPVLSVAVLAARLFTLTSHKDARQ